MSTKREWGWQMLTQKGKRAIRVLPLILIFKKSFRGAWVAQLVKHWLWLRSWHDVTAHGFEPCIWLCADSSEPGACFRFCLLLSLCLLPVPSLSKNKHQKKKKVFFNIYLFSRESERASRGGAEREGDTQREASSRLWAISTEPNVGLELTSCEIMTWAQVGGLPDCAPHHAFLKKCLMFIYFWERERWSMRGGGAERGGDTESEAGSRLWAISTEPNVGLQFMNYEVMIWAEIGRASCRERVCLYV